MNCTAWNSVRASELDARPIDIPRTAERTETPTSIHSGPATSSPRTQMAYVATKEVWISAAKPRAIA